MISHTELWLNWTPHLIPLVFVTELERRLLMFFCSLSAPHLEMDCVVTFEHFDPEGKCKTKSLSLAINGRASVCLLIAPLEVRWDSFTVDRADNKPRPPAGVIPYRRKRSPPLSSRGAQPPCLIICREPLLNTLPSFPVETAMKISDVQQDCWLERKRWIPTSSSLQKDLVGGFSHGQGSDCFLNGLLTLLLQ